MLRSRNLQLAATSLDRWITEYSGSLLLQSRSARLARTTLGRWIERFDQITIDLDAQSTAFAARSSRVVLANSLSSWITKFDRNSVLLDQASLYHDTCVTVRVLGRWRAALKSRRLDAERADVARAFFVQRRLWNTWHRRAAENCQHRWIAARNKSLLRQAFGRAFRFCFFCGWSLIRRVFRMEGRDATSQHGSDRRRGDAVRHRHSQSARDSFFSCSDDFATLSESSVTLCQSGRPAWSTYAPVRWKYKLATTNRSSARYSSNGPINAYNTARILVSSKASATSGKKVSLSILPKIIFSRKFTIPPPELHRKVFRHWLYSTRKNLELTRKLERRLEEENRATLEFVWEKWRDRFGESTLLELELQVVEQRNAGSKRRVLNSWINRSLVCRSLFLRVVSLMLVADLTSDSIRCGAYTTTSIRCVAGSSTETSARFASERMGYAQNCRSVLRVSLIDALRLTVDCRARLSDLAHEDSIEERRSSCEVISLRLVAANGADGCTAQSIPCSRYLGAPCTVFPFFNSRKTIFGRSVDYTDPGSTRVRRRRSQYDKANAPRITLPPDRSTFSFASFRIGILGRLAERLDRAVSSAHEGRSG